MMHNPPMIYDLEAGVDLAEEDFTWDDNDDDDQEGEASEGQGSITPRASQSLAGSQAGLPSKEPLTAEALASSLAALPVLDDQAAGPGNGAKARQGSDDEWGTEESLKSPSAKSFSIKSSNGMQSKSSTTNASSTRTSEDTYEVVDGVETPVRAPVASTTSVLSAASPPAPGQPVQHPSSSKSKSAESKVKRPQETMTGFYSQSYGQLTINCIGHPRIRRMTGAIGNNFMGLRHRDHHRQLPK
jgi:hypothetical protein